jgi:hypothetical protein
MEPRWREEWRFDPDRRFIGGTAEADLWVVYHRDRDSKEPTGKVASIRMVLGPGWDGWDWMWWASDGLRYPNANQSHAYKLARYFEKNKPLLDAYVRAFVPELED